jgi:hypothetical protein
MKRLHTCHRVQVEPTDAPPDALAEPNYAFLLRTEVWMSYYTLKGIAKTEDELL